MSAESELEALRRRLAQLPEEAPPPSLWLALQAAHAAEFRRQRRPRPRWPYAMAAVLMLAAVPVLLWHPPAPVPNAAPSLAPEASYQTTALRTLDRELQRRVLDGATDAELAPLWQQREQILRGQTLPPETPRHTTVRI
ncbi:MAG: hypothetical protein AB7E72_18615 [Lysobacterales bacterium]